MQIKRIRIWSGVVITLMVIALVAPVVVAQTATQTGVTVQREVTTDAQGNRLVTERTFRNGVLVQVEIKTFSPQGLLLRKVEETFINGRLVEREIVVFNAQGQIVSKTEFTFDAAGQIVKVEETTVTFQNGQRVQVEREFRLINGVLTRSSAKKRSSPSSTASGCASRGSSSCATASSPSWKKSARC